MDFTHIGYFTHIPKTYDLVSKYIYHMTLLLFGGYAMTTSYITFSAKQVMSSQSR